MKDDVNIFDIDGTLFNSNSTFDFLEFIYGKELRYKLIKLLYGNIFFKILNRIIFKIFNLDIKRKRFLSILNRVSKPNLDRMSCSFYNNFLKTKRKEELISILKTKADEKIVFASATLDFLAERICEELKKELDLKNVDFISSELFYKNGICCGYLKNDLLNKKLIKLVEMNIRLPFNLVVSDDIYDYQLMKSSKKAVVVLTPKNRKKWQTILREKSNFKIITV